LIIGISTVVIVKPINFEPWREICMFNYQDCRNTDNRLLTMQAFISLIHQMDESANFVIKTTRTEPLYNRTFHYVMYK